MSYRGDGEAHPERLAQLDAEIEALETRLLPRFWERVAPVWGIERRARRGPSALESRHRRIARLEEAIVRIEHGPAAEPELPRPAGRRASALVALDRVTDTLYGHLGEGVWEAAREHDPQVELMRWSPGARSLRFQLDDVPIAVSVVREQRRDQAFQVSTFETTVAPSAELRLKPEGILQDLKEMLGFGREIELGDPKFDPVFVIEGDEPSARAFLPKEVRGPLLAIGVEATPTVQITQGRARIRTHAASSRSAQRAFRVLTRWHRMPSPHPLLAPEPD